MRLNTIKIKIEQLQEKINKSIEIDGLSADKLLEISQELDILINKYYTYVNDKVEGDNHNT